MKEGRTRMQAVSTRTKEKEIERRSLTPIESYCLKVQASKRMSKYIDRSLSRSYQVILKAQEKQIHDRGKKK